MTEQKMPLWRGLLDCVTLTIAAVVIIIVWHVFDIQEDAEGVHYPED